MNLKIDDLNWWWLNLIEIDDLNWWWFNWLKKTTGIDDLIDLIDLIEIKDDDELI